MSTETETGSDTRTSTELEIGCECELRDWKCERPADWWVIVHDVTHADEDRDEQGNVSIYICSTCWQNFINSIDDVIETAAKLGKHAFCRCGLPIRCRTSIVYRVKPIRGTKR
jgi:hypothetical protein